MLGAERGQVTRMLLIEGLIQGVLGTGLGLLLGFGFAVEMVGFINRFAPQYAPGLHVVMGFNRLALVLGIGFGLGTTLLASALPARSAGKVSPLEALRPGAPASSRRTMRWSLIGGLIILRSGPPPGTAGMAPAWGCV